MVELVAISLAITATNAGQGVLIAVVLSVDGHHGARVITNGFPGGTRLAGQVLASIAATAAWPAGRGVTG